MGEIMSQIVTVTRVETVAVNLPEFTEANTPRLWWKGTAEETQAAVAEAISDGHLPLHHVAEWAERVTGAYPNHQGSDRTSASFETVPATIYPDGPTAPLTSDNPEISYASGVALAAAAMPAV